MQKLKPAHASFEFTVISYDCHKKEYLLVNKVTGAEKKLSRVEFDILFKEQYSSAKRKLR